MSLIAARSAMGLRTDHHDDRYFSFACVDGAPELETTYQVRHQVYCLERGFLPSEDYPDGLESDVYDSCAVHILAVHRCGEPAGTARLVLSSSLGFPLMEHCLFTGDYAFLNDRAHPGVARYAEVSRLAISKSFRRRVGDTPYGGAPRVEAESAPRQQDVVPFLPPKRAPEILLGICRELYQESKRRGITHWLLAMEKSLYLLLKRMGFKYVPAGPEVDYYGPVRPYVASLAALETGLLAAFPATLEYLARGLEPELMPDCLRQSAERDVLAEAMVG